MKSRFSLLALFGAASAQAADNNVDIGAESDGPFALVGNFLQQVVDFGGGPAVTFIVFFSAVGAVGLWMMVPKEASKAVGWFFRVCIGALLILNIALIITWYKGF
ncbi:hypothetical protein GIV96_25590 [Pseudomonas syringae]|uniref:hypothetical protein n=1 Tax=Pseudomonas syringae TaxID=317 RepID=UPI001F1603D5|nr:hypothetical protein [Pseudomonas syringae]MCF5395296.1 hypothetical protein [Pseudomonas syringae]MCF5403352.1 hypothetical protein [Pseudomonas syringae]